MGAYPVADGIAAVLQLDLDALRAWRSGPIASPWQEWARVWEMLWRGNPDATNAGTALERSAHASGDAALVVEAATLRAFAAERRGDLDEAISHARRASRMGRTEAIAVHEYLPNLVLARLRRVSGQPHYSARILRALSRATPGGWQGWIEWELALAAADVSPSPGSRAAMLRELVGHADRSDKPALEATLANLLGGSSPGWVENDADAVATAVDASRPPAGHDIEEWARGRDGKTPGTLHAVLALRGSAPAEESVSAYLHVPIDGPSRRVPRVGYSLIAAHGTRLPQSKRKRGRSETLVAELASHDRCLPLTTLYERVYGFAFDPPRHENTFHVALHRAREWLGELATLELTEGRLSLSVAEPMIVPDPRCEAPMEDRLLVAVAQHPGSSATDLARRLRVHVRVAQRALRELEEQGACVSTAQGRRRSWTVEDTTFREPTALRAE